MYRSEEDRDSETQAHSYDVLQSESTPVEASSNDADTQSSVPAPSDSVESKSDTFFRVPPPDDTVPAPKPGGTFYHIVKRIFDIVFSLILIVLLAIPVAIICVIIRIDTPGSPIFKQERVGWHGKTIYIYKLRTMYEDAHDHPERYLSPEQMEQWLREQKVDDDPRITRVGHFLRKFSLDELPQFINVLKGELSVIGPRPVTEKETWEYGDARDLVLSIKPGITGWWQVTMRNDATWENGDRQMLEVFYARHASFALDLRIFVRTFKAMTTGR